MLQLPLFLTDFVKKIEIIMTSSEYQDDKSKKNKTSGFMIVIENKIKKKWI